VGHIMFSFSFVTPLKQISKTWPNHSWQK